MFPDVGGELVIRLQLLAQGRGAAALPRPMALYTGLPVSRSQTMVVSRWLVIPIAATLGGVHPALGPAPR